MFKVLIASLTLLPTFSAFAIDSDNVRLPKKAQMSISCFGEGDERTYKGRDAESLVLKRVVAGSMVKYELYLYDALIFACDQISVN